MFIPYVHAGPTGGNVIGGSGSISQSGLNTTVNQTTGSMAINWDSYNLSVNERVQYIQPDSSSLSLNRILSHSGSQIHGRIDANGQVILVNPNGVFFGPTSQINVGGLIASGLDISPSDFMNGDYIFNEVLGTSGTVINIGLINASLGGNVTLVGKQVRNEGVINARLGAVNMAAGKQAVLTFDNQGLIGVKVSKEILQDELGIDPALINSGEINAESGRVLLTANVSRDVFSQAVNTGDIEQASSVLVNADGSFSLGSGADVVISGVINVSASSNNAKAGDVVIIGENITHAGVITADITSNTNSAVAGSIELHANDTVELKEAASISARAETSGTGGKVKVLGNKIGLLGSSVVDVSGVNGGGEALIGGDRQGLNEYIRNAEFLFMGNESKVFADALDRGNGGRIIAYADVTGRFYGGLYARGGVKGGDGGFIETSGKRGFEISNAPAVSASKGDGGLWLIDPYNITIQNGTGAGDFDFGESGSTIYTSNGAAAVIETETIEAALTDGGNVQIITGAGGDPLEGDITFAADTHLDFNSVGNNKTSTLTLTADRNIIFEADTVDDPLLATIYDSAANSSSQLNVVLEADNNNSGVGSITLKGGVEIKTEGGNFNATGVDFSISAPIDGAIINTNDGNFAVSGTNFNSGDGSIDVGAGSINLDGVSGAVHLGNLIASSGANSDLLIKGASSISQKAGTAVIIARDSYFGNSTSSITLDQGGNGFGGFIDLQANTASITASGVIQINAGSVINNSLSLTSINGGALNVITSGTGAIKVSNGTGGNLGTATATFDTTGNVNFSDSDNDFDQVIITSANTADIRDTNNLEIGNTTISGVSGTTLTLSAGGDLTQTTGSTISNNGVGAITNLTANGDSISLDESNNNFAIVEIVDAAFATLRDINAIQFDDVNLTGTGKNFIINAGGGISQVSGKQIINTASGAITEINAAGQAVILSETNNDFTQVNINVLTADILDNNSIVIGASNITGTGTSLKVTAENTGNISQAGGSTIENKAVGAVTELIAANSNITLDGDANDFTAVKFDGATNVNLHDVNSIILEASSIGGTLDVVANGTGEITQSGTLDVSGNTTLSASGSNITLDNNTNDFQAAVRSTAINVDLHDKNSIDLGASIVTGALDIVAVGDITDSEAVDVTGITTLTAGANNIKLDNLGNKFSTVNILSDNDVTLFDSVGAISLQNSGTLTTLAVTATGNDTLNSTINNSGALAVSGNASFTVNDGESIDLTNAANSFGTDPVFNADSGRIKNIAVTDTTDITIQNGLGISGTLDVIASNIVLQDTSVDGSLNLTANAVDVALAPIGTITQTDVLTVGGVSTLSGKTITLDNIGNDFQGNVVVNNILSVVKLEDSAGGIQLGDMGVSGTFQSASLDVKSTGGDITQANSITTGVTLLDAGTNSITLANSGNDFTGNVSIVAANDASITDSNTLALHTATIGNNLTLDSGSTLTIGGANQTVSVVNDLTATSKGVIVQTGTASTLTVGGHSQLTARNLALVDQDITLTNSTNNFNTVEIVNARDVRIRDSTYSIGIQGNISGILNLTADGTNVAGYVISNPFELNVTDIATFTVSGGESINLGHVDNTFTADPVFKATTGRINNLIVNDSDALVLQTDLTLDGDLTVSASDITFKNTTLDTGYLAATTTTGQIHQLGDTRLSVNGTADLVSGAGGIDLQLLNDFQNTVTFNTSTAGNVIINDINGLEIGLSDIDGDLTVTAADVTETNLGSDGIRVVGASLFTVTDGHSITLDNNDNQFSSVDFATKLGGFFGNVSVSNNGSIELSGLKLNNDLTVVSTGNITNTGALDVNGLTKLTANNIILEHMDNDFTNMQVVSGATVLVTDKDTVNFVGTSSITNSLTVNVANGGITDNVGTLAAGSLIVATNTALTTANGNIVLDNGSHDFNSIQVSSTGSSTITDINAIDIGDSVIAGDLSLSADGNINNLVGDLIVTGTTSLTSSAGADLLLARVGSNHVMSGPISISGASGSRLNNVQIKNSVATNLQNINAINLLVNSAGNITDSGVIDVTSATILTSTGDIALDSPANDNVLNSIAVTSANDVSVNNSVALQLDSINMSGKLTVLANGISTTNDLVANTGMDLNAGRGALNLNNNLTTSNGDLLLTAGQNINQQQLIQSTTGNVVLDSEKSIVMSNTAGTLATGDITYTSVGDQAVASLKSTGGSISMTSSNGAINDANAHAHGVNYTASSIILRANSGIGSTDAIETSTAELDVINNGTGQVKITNTGNVLLTNLVNNGDIKFSNNNNVTIDHVDAGFTVGTFLMEVANGSVFGVNRGSTSFLSVPDITADRAEILVLNGDFGTFSRPIVLKLNSELLLHSTISNKFFFEGREPGVVNDTSELQISLPDLLNSASGQRLIEIESLADIDPAIFTELHNYNQENISIRLPRDQIFDDELESYDRL